MWRCWSGITPACRMPSSASIPARSAAAPWRVPPMPSTARRWRWTWALPAPPATAWIRCLTAITWWSWCTWRRSPWPICRVLPKIWSSTTPARRALSSSPMRSPPAPPWCHRRRTRTRWNWSAAKPAGWWVPSWACWWASRRCRWPTTRTCRKTRRGCSMPSIPGMTASTWRPWCWSTSK